MGCWFDSSISGNGVVACFCEHCNEDSCPIKCWEFLGWAISCWFLKKGSSTGISYLKTYLRKMETAGTSKVGVTSTQITFVTQTFKESFYWECSVKKCLFITVTDYFVQPGLSIYIYIYIYIVTVVPLLCSDREKKHPLLGNDSINTFSWKRYPVYH
jgi:hypothetical protein